MITGPAMTYRADPGQVVRTSFIEPNDDIVSEVANGAVDGRPLPPVELLSYYFLLVVAGGYLLRVWRAIRHGVDEPAHPEMEHVDR